MKHHKYRQKLINLLLRMMLGLDNINIVANSLYIFTSVFKKMSYVEFILICLDLFLISIFQFKLYSIFLKYRGRGVSTIKNQLDLNFVLVIFFLQNGTKIQTPTILIQTWTASIRMIIIFSLQAYEGVFGVSLLVAEVFIIIALVYFYRRKSQFFLSGFTTFIVMETIQGILQILVAVGAVFKSNILNKEEGTFEYLATAQIITMILWIFVCAVYSI